MNIIIATSDLKLNNSIIEKYEEAGVQLNITEVDYLEDILDKVWDVDPELIIINDEVLTREPIHVKSKRDIFFYQFITKKLVDFETVFVVQSRNTNNDLIKKFMETEYFSILPYDRIDRIHELPDSKEELEELLGGEHELYIKEYAKNLEGDSDSFVAPPTKTVDIHYTRDSYPENGHSLIYLPNNQANVLNKINLTNPIVSVFWSPIPNVGVSSFIKALGYTLASNAKKVLIIELDWEYPKLARTTGLTHKERHLKAAINYILNNNFGIEGFIVNNQIAEEDLPFSYKQAKARLKDLPSSLFALSRNAEIKYEDVIDFDDDQIIEKLFFQAKQAGFEHIIVDVPSNPQNVFTMLSMLCSNELFAFVDDSFATSGLFKLAMETLTDIDITKDNFQLIVNKTREESGISAHSIADFYDMNAVLSLPYDDELSFKQLDLRLEGGKEYMEKVRSFATRYGINASTSIEIKKKKGLFSLK